MVDRNTMKVLCVCVCVCIFEDHGNAIDYSEKNSNYTWFTSILGTFENNKV